MGYEFCVQYEARLKKDGDTLDSARAAFKESGEKEELRIDVERAKRDLDETQRLIGEHQRDPAFHPESAGSPTDNLSG